MGECAKTNGAGSIEYFIVEAYSGAGKTHLCQQVENQKEYAI